MYRTLYLDRLLEENNGIYNSRDSHFRKIVKEFKTFNDADFEEPKELSGIMRPYQKKGFKWMRTLESCGFGGILADDMGLGKTLQAIAVLSSAKQEGKVGTSLVISPASLVFNWGEEFQRFAPDLKIQTITGTQTERQDLIEHYNDADVLVTSLCFENYNGEAAKADACLDLVTSAIDGGHRILLFSQFTTMLDILQTRFEEAGIAYYIITGSTSKERRLQLVKDFNQGNTPLFLISLKAGGVGLNLTGADVVIHYDPWWNQAVQNQATDRAHRIGQTKKVTVYKLIAKNTIEEKIEKLQQTKKDLADQIIGGDNTQLTGMSKEELLELLDV